MFNVQITQIKNGYLIAIPPDDGEMRAAQIAQRQPQGKVTYCEDFDSVTAALKDSWPVSVVG